MTTANVEWFVLRARLNTSGGMHGDSLRIQNDLEVLHCNFCQNNVGDKTL